MKASMMSSDRGGAALLRCARKSQGLSISAACAAIGVSPATLKRWEAGNGLPGSVTVDRILETWGVSESSPMRSGLHCESLGRRASWSVEQSEPRPVLRLLRHRRRRNRLTLEEVSCATGLGVASLQRYETGLRIPSRDTLEGIASAVGCTAEESGLLFQTLTSPELEARPFAVGEVFMRPNAHPGFWIFRELDFLCRFHHQQSPSALDARVTSVIMGLAFTGDYAALLEAWQDTKALVSKPKPLGILQGVLCMSRMHLAKRPKESRAEFVRMRRLIPDQPRTADEVNGTFSTIRMAQMLDEHEEADLLLGRLESSHDSDLGTDASCKVYRHLVNFAVGEATDSVEGLQAVRMVANPILAYTTRVAELSILTKMGRRAEALEALRDCEDSERTFSLGSPLAQKLKRSLIPA